MGKKLLFLMEGIVIVCGAAYFLYRSAYAVPFLLPLGLLWFREKNREEMEKKKQELRWQFKELLLSVAGSLQAGYSVENAFRSAEKELAGLYGEKADIVRELTLIERALQNNIPAETALLEFGERSDVREIRDFAQIFSIGKRSGADMGDMIGNTVEIIGEKMETSREIRTVMSAKVMEQKVMSIVPFGIMTYIGVTSPGFFKILYHNLTGVMFMSFCLVLYLGAVWTAKRIVYIKI